MTKPSERDLERARDAYLIFMGLPKGQWNLLADNERAENFTSKYAEALANERASLPESVMGKLHKIKTWQHWCGQAKCTCRQDFAAFAMEEICAWQQGEGPEPRKDL